MSRGSRIWVATGSRRSSAPSGSWKIICMRARCARQAATPGATIGLPSNRTSPRSGGSRPSTMRPVVDLPEPDSPTRPSVSPLGMASDTPSTAWTAVLRPNIPERML
jgi:hypothetical protein